MNLRIASAEPSIGSLESDAHRFKLGDDTIDSPMKTRRQNIESIDDHLSRRVRPVKAEDIGAEVTQQLGVLSIPAIYRDKIRSQRTRQYELRAPAKKLQVEILHTLLGIELKVGNRRLLCPDLATARYLSVFARLGCDIIAVPYDITQISWIADELESSWQRMMLLVEHLTHGRSERLRAMVRRRLIGEARSEIDSLGAGSRFPEFDQPNRQRRGGR